MTQRQDVNKSAYELTDKIDSSDRGLAYGDGLFETIAYVGGVLHNWDLHWQRLLSGARRLVIDLPDQQFFLEQINLKINQDSQLTNSLSDSLCTSISNSISNSISTNRVIKIIVTRGLGGRGYLYPEPQKSTIIVSVHAWPERAAEDYHCGIRAIVCQTCLAKQPALAGIKHLNRLEQILGRNEFSNSHYLEGIMLACSDNPLTNSSKTDSLIIEGTSSNLFFVNNGRLLTPAIDTCGVQGTIRQLIFALAKQMDIVIEENHYPLSELENASEVFFTNSIFGVMPVASITMSEEVQWQYDLGASQQKIASVLAKIINKELNRPEALFI